jgi:hypothetical protein
MTDSTNATERLIARLGEDLEPVRPLPRLRSAFAIVLTVWATFLGLAVLGSEATIATGSLMGNQIYLASFVGLVLAALGATASALAAGIPGRENVETIGMMFAAVFLSLLPAGVILSFLVRGWTARPIRAALIALLGAGALGAVVVHLSCGFVGPKHVILGHMSVPIVLTLLGAYPVAVVLRKLRG